MGGFPGFFGLWSPTMGGPTPGAIGPWLSSNGWKPPGKAGQAQWLGNAPYVYPFEVIWRTMNEMGIPVTLLNRRGPALNAWVWGTGHAENPVLHVVDENGGVLYEGPPIYPSAPQLIPRITDDSGNPL